MSRDAKAMVGAYPSQLVLLHLHLGRVTVLVEGSNRVDGPRSELEELEKLVPRLGRLVPGEEPKANMVD